MQNRVDQNPLLSRFQQFRSNTHVPFDNNKLINSDPRLIQTSRHEPSDPCSSVNVIEQILKPVDIKNVRNNDDVMFNYTAKKRIRDQTGDIEYVDTQYKSIIKQPLNKPLSELKPEDLIIHKVDKKVDGDLSLFNKDLETKTHARKQDSLVLKQEYSDKNYSKHRKAFEYNESFIVNMAYEEKIFDDNKQDCIAFYQKKQRELEEGRKTCDQVLRDLMNKGLISEDEIPS